VRVGAISLKLGTEWRDRHMAETARDEGKPLEPKNSRSSGGFGNEMTVA